MNNHSMPIKRPALTIAITMLLTVLSGVIHAANDSRAVLYSADDELIKISNDYYEVALNAKHGGIFYITDKNSGKRLIEDNSARDLWSAIVDKGSPIQSNSYRKVVATWNESSQSLVLLYSGDIEVKIVISVSDEPVMRLQAQVANKSTATITSFSLPGALRLASGTIQNGLLPMMPGALISPKFFSDGRTYINEYPGVMFADYIAVNSKDGELALYTQKGSMLQPSLFGFQHSKEERGITSIIHSYRTWVATGKKWQSPILTIVIGEDYPLTIARYRVDNQIDKYNSLRMKLGDSTAKFFASPMYKLDLAVLKLKFEALEGSVLEKLNIPGMVHLVAFQTGGHDHNYPDFIPPDKKWGTTNDFAELVSWIHQKGGLAIPYTNFSWWDNDGLTLSKLPANTLLNSLINIKDSHGLPGFETYGPNSGFVMNLNSQFVQDKISEQHKLLVGTVGVDAIFEDQWGNRNAPYDFNLIDSGRYDPATSYFESVLNHYRIHNSSHLFTESGVDVLADDGIGFMGTNYLWDMLGYRSATADVTMYYPMASMLFRDKVLLYQHNLAAETWTNNKDMLRWNMAQGYGLSNSFWDSSIPGLNMDNDWLNLVGIFQKYVLANYADELVTEFSSLDNGVARTSFVTYKVYANWDPNIPATLELYTLAPGGVAVEANDGSVTAGVFTEYNGIVLTQGDHYIAEIRTPSDIKLFQPVGADTKVRIRLNTGWEHITVSARTFDGIEIGFPHAMVEEGNVEFVYAATLNGHPVAYYQIVPDM